MSTLIGRKILITGVSSGIGKATAYYLAERGASIVGVDMNTEGLSLLKSDFEAKGYSIICVEENLQNENLEDIFIRATLDGSKLNGLVHCAGISSIVPIASLDKLKLHKVMDINFYSFVELCRQYSKKKYSDCGSIVGISSLAAEMPRAYELAYITSKAAMNAAIPCLAIELAAKRIRVNGIMPGVVKTSMIKEQQSEEQKKFIEKMEQKTLLGAALPEEISSVVSFLLGDDSKMITGRVISVDGGMFL